MGALSQSITLTGRSVEDFGLAFEFLKKESVERMYLIEVTEEGKVVNPFLYAYGQQDKVVFDMERLSRYISDFIEHGFVMLHNHPNGSGPSAADWRVTIDIVKLCKAHNKILYDHCVVSYMDYYLRTLAPEVFQCTP